MKSTVSSPALRFNKLGWAGLAVLSATALALSHGLFPIEALESMRLCAWRAITSWRCPGCGMGHSLLAALQGNFGQSWQHHPLGLPLLAVWIGWLLGRFHPAGLARGVRGPALIGFVFLVHALRAL